jgi:3-methylfumaryl-CoA hydratase
LELPRGHIQTRDQIVTLDIDHLKSWVGKTEESSDIVTPHLVYRYRSTVEAAPTLPRAGETAPPGIHWCLSPPVIPMSEVGPDGHAKRGGFLPPVPLPRRMWAGGRIAFHAPILVGDEVTRRSTIASVDVKQGRTGTLCFVGVDHELSTARGVARTERHDIVYRDVTPNAPAQKVETDSDPETLRGTVFGSPVLLLRYSALTFNGHRIHYDRDYCVREEGYAGLVVHGPLQATLMLEQAARELGQDRLRSFDYRGLRPLIDGADFTIHSRKSADGLACWVCDKDGYRTFQATTA